MKKTIVAINAGPRFGWNTETLVINAADGAESVGAKVIRFDLFRLKEYTGCISCFACKQEQSKGRCAYHDGLTPVLDSIKKSDGLIIGSPNYLHEMTASFRALYERLVFQHMSYNKYWPCYNQNPIPVLLIMTCNSDETRYSSLLNNYQRVLNCYVGPTQYYICGDTLQIKDYRDTDWPWSKYNPEQKQKRHENIFPLQCKEVFDLGIMLTRRWENE